MLRGRSALRESRRGLPLSSDSSAANSGRFCSIRSASLLILRPRSAALIFFQGPDSNAFLAAFTARSTSAESASATWQISCPVEGFKVANVLPDILLTHFPLMNNF